MNVEELFAASEMAAATMERMCAMGSALPARQGQAEVVSRRRYRRRAFQVGPLHRQLNVSVLRYHYHLTATAELPVRHYIQPSKRGVRVIPQEIPAGRPNVGVVSAKSISRM